jgi:D-arabinonate dehydratase/D-galactarolactone cycloisomerase
MRIISVETFVVQAPFRAVAYWGTDLWARASDPMAYPAPRRMRPVYPTHATTVLVRLTSDEGISGWGEAKAPVAPEVTARLVHELLAPPLLEQDPLEIRVVWERLYNGMRLRGHSRGFWLEALSGVDIALWDLAGQALGQPVYKLLGGAHQRQVPVYASGIPPVLLSAPADRWEVVRQVAQQYAQDGYRMIKVGAGLGVDSDLATVAAVQAAAGPGVSICTDAVGLYDRGTAATLAKGLGQQGVAWLEGPLAPDDLAGYAELARQVELPIAYYVLFTHRDVKDLLHHGGVDILQPDVCRCGGITEAFRIAELADSFNLAFSLHGSVGSVISIAAALHLSAAVPNLRSVEYWTDKTPLMTDLAESPVLPLAGLLVVRDTPGLGLTLDETVLRSCTVARFEQGGA